MPRKPHTVQTSAETAGTTEPVTSAETVVCTLGGISPDGSSPRILLEGGCTVVGAATATTCIARIRRGNSTAGALVSAATTAVAAAGTSVDVSLMAFDQPATELASQPYVLTIEQPAATANPKVTGAILTATF